MTTHPAVSTDKNGSNTATTEEQYFDNMGRLRWTRDGEGYCNYYSYHPEFGTQTYIVRDAPTWHPVATLPYSANNNPTKWDDYTVGSFDTPTRGGGLPAALEQVSKSELDTQGRTVLEVTEDGQNDADLAKKYTVYETAVVSGQEIDRIMRFSYHWNAATSSFQQFLPTEVSVANGGGNAIESYTVDPGCTSASSGVPTGISARRATTRAGLATPTTPSPGSRSTWTATTPTSAVGPANSLPTSIAPATCTMGWVGGQSRTSS